MARLKLLLSGCILLISLAPSASGRETLANSAQGVVSPIAPDLAIVTEISLDTPYLGQQFCIIYKLRAQRPPAAVDVDPQQYSGFWTEAVSLSANAASSARPVKGQKAVDYLLRQVIAYPLLEGMQKLPPLSVKVKRAGNTSAKPDDWDVVGASSAVNVQVMPLPPGPPSASGVPFVGGIQAAWSLSGENPGELQLEIQGTANLAFFRPLDWLRPPAGVRIREHLAGTENLAQTVDIEGRRQLSFLQRQRWLISLSGFRSGQRIEGFFLPVFEPREKTWKSIRVEGISIPGTEISATEPAIPGSPSAAVADLRARHALSKEMVIAIALAAGAGLLAWIFWRRRRKSRGDLGAGASISALEKKLRTSPRAFLDGAHKVLLRCAAEMQRSHNLGIEDTELDRCWISVQRYRFNKEPLSHETCAEIMQTIQHILLTISNMDAPPSQRHRQ